MRVVVVGASGNVGTALLRRLAGDETVTSVVAVARRVPRGTPPPPYDVATWVACDVADPAAVDVLTAAFAGRRRGRPPRVGDPAEPRPTPPARRERRRAPGACSRPPAGPASRTSSSPPASAPTRRLPTTCRAARAGRPTGCARRRTASTRPRSSGCSTRPRPRPGPRDRAAAARARVPAGRRARDLPVLPRPVGAEAGARRVPRRCCRGRRGCGSRWCTRTTSRARSARRSCVGCAVRSTSPRPDVLRGQDVADVVARGRLREVPVGAGARSRRRRVARPRGAGRTRLARHGPGRSAARHLPRRA